MNNMFNNSYNSGPSEFSGSQIGGGFVSNENFNSSNKPMLAKIPFDQRKLSQVTIKQIITAPPPQPDEYLMIDGVEISQVMMLAQIQSIDIQSAHTTFKVTDYTGSLDAKQWSNDSAPQQKQMNLREGQWVRIVGKIHHYNGRCSVNLFNIDPVSDFNEMTHHFLEVIYAHLINSTPNPFPHSKTMGNNNTQMGNNMNSNSNNNNTNNQWNNNNQFGNSGNNNYGNNNQWNNNGNQWNNNSVNKYGNLPPIQIKVLKIIDTPEIEQSDRGCNVEQIFQRLSDEDVNKIRAAIDDLACAGHIYSTLDEDHYKYSGDQ